MVLLRVVDIEQGYQLEDNEQEPMQELEGEEKKQWQEKINKLYLKNIIPGWGI